MNAAAALELPPPRETVRLSGPLALVAAIPLLLGFHPARSLVLLCVHGVRHRVGPALRIDLPIPADVEAAASFLALQAARHATAVMLICYAGDADDFARGRPVLPHDALMRSCLRELDDHGVPVIDAVLVRSGALWSYLHGTATGPGQRLPTDDDPALTHLRAAQVSAGRAVLGDRDAITRAIAAPTGESAVASDQAVMAAFEKFGAGIAELDYRGTVELGCRVAHASLTAAIGAHRRGDARDETVWGDLVATLTVDLVRDAVISWCLERVGECPVGLFIDLAHWVTDDFAVPLLSVLALVAYRSGDGALANVSLERALDIDPEYRLAVLAREFMVNGVHPTELDALIIDWADHPGNPAAPMWLRRLDELASLDDDDLGGIQ